MAAILKVDGVNYEGWTALSITKSIEQLAGNFQLDLVERWSETVEPVPIATGSGCVVTLDKTDVIAGYVDALEINYAAGEHKIVVRGRDKAGDFVDCSAPSKSWANVSLFELAQELAKPFNILVKNLSNKNNRFKSVVAQQGESCFRLLSRLAVLSGVLIISDRDGNLVIATSENPQKSSVILKQGINIKSAAFSNDYSDVFSQITVKGQSAMADMDEASEADVSPEFTIKSTKTLARHRPLILIAEDSANASYCKTRAQWEVANRLAKAKRLRITVQGWHEEDKLLWDVNRLIKVESPFIRQNDYWLIASCRFRLDQGGSSTELSLVPKNAFVPQPEIPENKDASAPSRFEKL